MEQILFLYFSRVVVTLFGGFFLAHEIIVAKFPILEGLYQFLNRSTTSRLILAFFSMLIGLVSLIIGRFYLDFFPSILAIIVAKILFLQEYIKSGNTQNKLTEVLNKYGTHYKQQWGLATIAFSILHLFFANVAWI